MMNEYVVVGHFRHLEDVLAVIRSLREKGAANYDVYSPFPNHELEAEEYAGKPRSPVRFFTLLGGVLGCLGGFLMTSWMSIDYPLRTSAKTLISAPAFVVIAFECSVLFASLFNIGAMFFFDRLPTVSATPGYRKAFSGGEFGVCIRVVRAEAEHWQEFLKRSGAHTVEMEYTR